ncbi:MAG: class D sortase [Saccharofermentans sp.]|nr:class D sortase [Saccharofermentans sp.]
MSKSKAFQRAFIAFAVLLMLTGIVLLLIEPIKRFNRRRISNEALSAIEKKIESTADEAEMTFVVPKNGNEVEGEDYDFIEETEETAEEEEYSGETVVLNSIGILSISKINCRYSVWDEATQVSLRYGLAHYPDSVMPGEKGNATIMGHNYRDGSMFHRLGELKAGDKVVFTGKDGVDRVFYVEESKIVSSDDLLDYALGNITDERQLTLVTCTYEYGRYGWRRIVICKMEGEPETEETSEITETDASVTEESSYETSEESITETPTEEDTVTYEEITFPEETEADNGTTSDTEAENTP